MHAYLDSIDEWEGKCKNDNDERDDCQYHGAATPTPHVHIICYIYRGNGLVVFVPPLHDPWESLGGQTINRHSHRARHTKLTLASYKYVHVHGQQKENLIASYMYVQ